jgi:hypothetical protein
MAQTPDRRPGALEEDEEIRLIANAVSPTLSGAFNFNGVSFVFRDAQGDFDPRGSSYWLSESPNLIFSTGSVSITGSMTAKLGFSGSLTTLADGTSYLRAGTNITITSASNGAVTISSTAASTGGEVSASYVVLSATSSLANERVLTAGNGITFQDNGAGNTLVISSVSPALGYYSASFTNGDLTGGTLTVTHNLGYKYITVGVYDQNNYLVIPTNVILIDSSSFTLDLSSYGAIAGTWHVTSFVGGGQQGPTGSAGAPGANADSAASFLVLSATASLSNERVFTVGTGLSGSDGGANGNYTLSINNAVVATVSGTTFTGPVSAQGGLTGSLQVITDGVPYIVAGPNITINTSSVGQISITGSSAGATGEVSASYLVLSVTSSLANERAFAVGTGLTSSDGGAGGTYTVSVLNSVVATLSGAVFTGPVVFGSGLTGSLQEVSSGVPYLVAGPNITINTASNGQVSITGSASGATGEVSASYLVLSATASLANERVLTPGTGLSGSDGGANGSYTLSIDNSVVATISGATFTGPVKFNQGLSGSLTSLSDGTPYLLAGASVSITTGANGSITISSTGGGGGSGDAFASYVVMSATGSLTAERVLTAGSGISITDGGAGGNVVISANTSGVARGYFSASFTNANLTGSILPLTHSIGSKYVAVQIFDNNDYMINPDEIRLINDNVATVDLSSFGTIPGTWTAVVVAGKGSIQVNVVSRTSNYTAVPGDTIFCNTTAGGFTVTLPSAAANLATQITIKKVSTDGKILTIATTGGETIDGSTSLLIQDAWTSVTLVNGPSSWFIV